LIVQLAPAAKLAPQVLVCAKFVTFPPVNPMLLISSEPLPAGAVLVSVTGCDALVEPTFWPEKFSAADNRVADVEGTMPVPVSTAVAGLASSVPATASVAEREPVAVGPNVTLIVQLVPAAKVVPQVPPAVRAGRTNTPVVVGTIGVSVMFMVVSGTVPVLDSVTVCGALVVSIVWDGKAVTADRVTVVWTMPDMAAFSAGAEPRTLRLVVRVPAALGVNVTLIVQLAPAAKLAPQVLVCAKSVVFPPVNPMLVISSELLVSVLVSVTGCAALVVPTVGTAKVSAGDRVADAEGTTPVPVSIAVIGLARPATATDSMAEREPVAVGLNVTLIVQFAPTAKSVPQVPPAVRAGRTNTPVVVGTMGAIVMFMDVSGTVPVLDNVSVCGALLVVSVWDGNGVGVDTVGDGATMVPVSATDCGEPTPALTVSVAAFWTGEATVGVKVTLIAQVPATGTAVQLLVWPNCEESVPPRVIPPTPVSVRGAWPVLVTATG
jgi:hypothetical protein